MRSRSGFTLIELLAIISIVGFIASAGSLAFRTVKEKARITKGLEFSQNLYSAMGSEAMGIWKFDEGEGTKAIDASGLKNDGTLSNGPIRSCASTDENNTPSGEGCSFNFNGINQSIILNTVGQYDNALTMSAWFKLADGATGRNTIVSMNKQFMEFIADTSVIRVWPNYSSGSSFVWKADTNWHHLAGVITKTSETTTNIKVYLDGNLAQNINKAGLDITGNDKRIASRSGAYFFKGKIDEVHIYRQALNLSQIQKIYADGERKLKLAEK